VPRTLILAIVLLAACDSRPPTTVPETRPQPSPPPAPETIRVVTLGDSLAYGAGDESGGGIARRLKDDLPNVETVNHGVNGAQTADVLFRLKQERLRGSIAEADAIVLSVGANDLFRTPNAREEVLRNPIVVASRILDRLADIVAELHRINPEARILILGGYNPVPDHPLATKIISTWRCGTRPSRHDSRTTRWWRW
jgi:lysophospholipase L1-like esterase